MAITGEVQQLRAHILSCTQELRTASDSETSKTSSTDKLLPERPHFLDVPEQLHELRTKCSNPRAYEGHSHSNHCTMKRRTQFSSQDLHGRGQL